MIFVIFSIPFFNLNFLHFILNYIIFFFLLYSFYYFKFFLFCFILLYYLPSDVKGMSYYCMSLVKFSICFLQQFTFFELPSKLQQRARDMQITHLKCNKCYKCYVYAKVTVTLIHKPQGRWQRNHLRNVNSFACSTDSLKAQIGMCICVGALTSMHITACGGSEYSHKQCEHIYVDTGMLVYSLFSIYVMYVTALVLVNKFTPLWTN